MAKNDICKERIFQIVSVTSQVAISRRVHRYKLALRNCQATRRRREEDGGLMPMAWGCHIDVEWGVARVGRKKASKGLEIFCLEWGRKRVLRIDSLGIL